MKANNKIIRREVFNLLLDFGYVEPIEVEILLALKGYTVKEGEVPLFLYNLSVKGEIERIKSGLDRFYRLTDEDGIGMEKLFNSLYS